MNKLTELNDRFELYDDTQELIDAVGDGIDEMDLTQEQRYYIIEVITNTKGLFELSKQLLAELKAKS